MLYSGDVMKAKIIGITKEEAKYIGVCDCLVGTYSTIEECKKIADTWA